MANGPRCPRWVTRTGRFPRGRVVSKPYRSSRAPGLYKGHTGSRWDWPAKTLKAGVHGVPGGENMLRADDGSVRYFTVREAARLQAFPDAYRFSGPWGECMRQLGNAVPVKVGQAAVGAQLRHTLLAVSEATRRESWASHPRHPLTNPAPYNPLDRAALGESVERSLLAAACGPLPPGPRFRGAGIYALYYHGSFEPYERLSSPTCERPIYIGKAVPPGSRKGGVGLRHRPRNRSVQSIETSRSKHHGRSEFGDPGFSCRYLVVDDIWIPLGESVAIQRFLPLWNVGP